MSFLFHKPEDVREKIRQGGAVPPPPSLFGRRDEFQQDHLTDRGIELLVWLCNGKVTKFRHENQWLEPVDSIAVLCFGADYDLLRQQWPIELQSDLDAFYGPFRCNTFLPETLVSDEFDCAVLNAIGVQYIYNPSQCRKLYHIGSRHPFIALFAEQCARRGSLPVKLESKLFELLSDPEWRDLLCRYDAMHQELRAAYYHSFVTGKHLLVTNRV